MSNFQENSAARALRWSLLGAALVLLACLLPAAQAEPAVVDSTDSASAAENVTGKAKAAPHGGEGSADTRKRRRARHHIGIGVGYGHYGHYGPYGHYRYGYGGYYGPYGPYGYVGPYGYGGWGYPRGPYGYGHGSRYRDRYLGAIDVNVRPKKTQVYVDGSLVGNAGEFDGQPRYLWLDKGSHEIIFYLDGHESVVRQVTARPGVVIPMKFRMQPGTATPAEELSTFDPNAPEAPEELGRPVSEGGTAWWREKTAPERYSGSGYETAGPEPLDVRQAPAKLSLKVEPAEASVYLDGRFIGTARELADFGPGLLIDPGEHRLEIVHPQFVSVTKSFSAESGKQVKLDLELKPR